MITEPEISAVTELDIKFGNWLSTELEVYRFAYEVEGKISLVRSLWEQAYEGKKSDPDTLYDLALLSEPKEFLEAVFKIIKGAEQTAYADKFNLS